MCITVKLTFTLCSYYRCIRWKHVRQTSKGKIPHSAIELKSYALIMGICLHIHIQSKPKKVEQDQETPTVSD